MALGRRRTLCDACLSAGIIGVTESESMDTCRLIVDRLDRSLSGQGLVRRGFGEWL